MCSAWNRNRLTALLGIDYPLIQGPLGGLSSQRLTAAVSNFGGMGSFGAHTLSPEGIHDAVREIRALTARPFAVNLWVSMEDPGARQSDAAAFARALVPLEPHLAELGVPEPAYRPYLPQSFEQQAQALIDAGPPVMSFIYGVPPHEVVAECRRRGIVTIGAATTPEEAVLVERSGVDAIVASGFEAGGHRGSFVREAEDSLMGSLALVPQVVDAVAIPVIAAGGIGDGRGVVAAFALGAEGVQMGTAFLKCDDSGASRLHRETLHSPRAGHTGLTRGFSGRLARGIHNLLMEALGRDPAAILPYPLQRAVARSIAVPADAAGRAELVPLWSGQSALLSRHRDAAALLQALVDDVAEVADAVTGWSGRREKPEVAC